MESNPHTRSASYKQPTGSQKANGSSIEEIYKLFGVSINNPKDIDVFTSDLESGKYELWVELTREKRLEIMNTLGELWNAFLAEADSISVRQAVKTSAPIQESPIVQSVDIHTKSSSYAGAAGASIKDQPKVRSNFRPLVADPVFDGVNISIPRKVVKTVSTRFEHTLYGYFIGKRMAFPVVEYYARNNWAKHGLKRIMMNSKGFFFFKFDTRAGLEVVLEGGPWLIRNSPIILKKWSMDTRLFKEELTSIPIWVKLHDVPIQVFEKDGRSRFARSLIEVNSEADLVDIVTIGVPSLNGDDFTKETIRVASPPIVTTSNVVTPTVEKTNDDFQTVGKKKKKGKSKSTNGGQFVGPTTKQNVRYEPKASINAPNKGATNVGIISI
ncbi:zinc knuckle CX2CX4HX4C containing protein [Tanacetum coccineum]